MNAFPLFFVLLAIAVTGYFCSAKGSVSKSLCFAFIILLTTFISACILAWLDSLEGATIDDVFIIAISLGIVGAFLGYAIMRNSGGGKNDDEKDKK